VYAPITSKTSMALRTTIRSRMSKRALIPSRMYKEVALKGYGDKALEGPKTSRAENVRGCAWTFGT
jgi:hypothetical protein